MPSWISDAPRSWIDLRELRAQFERAAERLDGLVVLPVLHEELAEAIVAQLVVRVVAGHLAKLGDALFEGSHCGGSGRLRLVFPLSPLWGEGRGEGHAPRGR